jgi:hypothetical protein
METIPNQIPTAKELIQSLSNEEKVILYKHFEGAVHPDELIYQAWLWANGWLHDPVINFNEVVSSSTHDFAILEVLDLDNISPPIYILHRVWNMEEVYHVLKALT